AGVTADIEALHFNTAIAKLMEFVNAFSKLPGYPREVLRMVTQTLAPLAPHIASEVWTHLKGEGSILTAPWPKIDHTYLESSTVTYIVQVNGRLRGRFDLPKHAAQEKIESLARSDERISRHLEKPISKVIFVPNKLVNFVTH